jgi:hypothetical protein
MLKTYLYIPDSLEEKIRQTSLVQKKSKAEVMRVALEDGLNNMRLKNTRGAQALLELAKEAGLLMAGEKLPRDLSVNHDYYLWGGKKRNSRIKP